jgi:hypothetical protein
LCYRGQGTSAPDWLDEDRGQSFPPFGTMSVEVLTLVLDHFQTLCSIEADLSGVFSTLEPQSGPFGSYYRKELDIVLLFGLTELKAQLCWYDDVC